MTYFLFPNTVTATDRDCTVLNFSRWNKHTFYFIVTEKYCYIVYMADQSNETGRAGPVETAYKVTGYKVNSLIKWIN